MLANATISPFSGSFYSPLTPQVSPAGLTRGSIFFARSLCEKDGLPGRPGNDNPGKWTCFAVRGTPSMALRNRDQILNCAVLIQSQKFAPGGFCRSLAYMVSKLPRVTKSYLLLCVVKPCTKVCSAM